MNRVIAHIRLMRPANIVTAVADIIAGFALSAAAIGMLSWDDVTSTSSLLTLLWLCLATIGLYGGGVAFNDVFDASLDRQERPERPIPSGEASVFSASILATLLLLAGILFAFQVSSLSGIIALAIAAMAVLYDAWGKHQTFFGPLNMGLCRGGNLLLGVSAVPALVDGFWYIALIPVIYIAAITMISRGEVHGGDVKTLKGAFLMYSFVLIAILALAIIYGKNWWQTIPFVFLHAYFILPPLFKAYKDPQAKFIGKAVKAGVISLIVLDASLGTAFGGWAFGVLILLLLPLSIWISGKFAVT